VTVAPMSELQPWELFFHVQILRELVHRF